MRKFVPAIGCALLIALAPDADVSASPAPPGIDPTLAEDHAILFAEGIVSTPQEELSGTFSPDLKEFYFTKSAPDYTEWFHTIVVSRFVKGRWTRPVVAPFSGRYSDSSPSMSADGRQLFFGSNRPVAGVDKATAEDSDLWVVERRPGGAWGEPRHLGTKINSTSRDSHPSIAADGTLYFQSTRPRASRRESDIANLYRSRLVNGEYGEAEDLGEPVNSDYFEMDPFIAPDQRYLIFATNGPSRGSEGPQLHISCARGGGWSIPVNLGPEVNGAGAASGGFVRKIGNDSYLFFNSASGQRIRKRFERPQRKLTYRELDAILASVEYGRRNFYYVRFRRELFCPQTMQGQLLGSASRSR